MSENVRILRKTLTEVLFKSPRYNSRLAREDFELSVETALEAMNDICYEHEALLEFANFVLGEFPDFPKDGFDIQDKAIDLGLLQERDKSEIKACVEKNEFCNCLEYYGDGEDIKCYRLLPDVKNAGEKNED